MIGILVDRNKSIILKNLTTKRLFLQDAVINNLCNLYNKTQILQLNLYSIFIRDKIGRKFSRGFVDVKCRIL